MTSVHQVHAPELGRRHVLDGSVQAFPGLESARTPQEGRRD